MLTRYYSQSRWHIIFDPESILEEPLSLFDGKNHKQSEMAPTVSGSVRFFVFKDQPFAFKHYRRRGFMATFLHNHYLWRRLENTRMWQEFHLLKALRDLRLPVPNPVAARCRYNRIGGYAGDLITHRLPDSCNLRSLLQESPIDPALWFEIGRVIAAFHESGVYHDDLNASNILIRSSEQVYLLDFDKCEIRTGSDSWKQANLRRLLRSLTKLRGSLEPFYFNDQAWTQLLAGYGSTGSSLSSIPGYPKASS